LGHIYAAGYLTGGLLFRARVVEIIECERLKWAGLPTSTFWKIADDRENAFNVAFGGKPDIGLCAAHVCF
jgi:hypothetical protein